MVPAPPPGGDGAPPSKGLPHYATDTGAALGLRLRHHQRAERLVQSGEIEAVQGLAGRFALVLDAAELLERAVAVERSLAHSEKLAAVGKLAARVAHEIRNPVTAARSLAQLMVRDPASPHAAEHAELILAELARPRARVRARRRQPHDQGRRAHPRRDQPAARDQGAGRRLPRRSLLSAERRARRHPVAARAAPPSPATAATSRRRPRRWACTASTCSSSWPSTASTPARFGNRPRHSELD